LRVKPILGVGILLVAAGGAFLIMTYLHASSPPPLPDLRSGSIILASPDPRACRHLSFDNVTGTIKDRGTGQCADDSPGAAERLGQVSDSFQRGR
jgi:hypothetical protein